MKETYANNFWQLGNFITGFGVTEALVVTLAIASRNGDLVRNFDHPGRRTAAACLSIAFHMVLCFGIFRCYAMQMQLLAIQDSPLAHGLRLVAFGQIGAVAFFGTLLVLAILSAHQPDHG